MEHNNFNDVAHLPLRTYNRAVMTFNLLEDFGQEGASQYLAQFSDSVKRQIFMLIEYIRRDGYKVVQQKCMAGQEFSDNGWG